MSASVGQAHPPRRDPAAEKARRQKVIAVVGVAVLAAVLAIQVPRTMKMLDSSSGTSAPTAAPAATPAPTPAPAPAPAEKAGAATKQSGELNALLRSRISDPFKSRGLSGLDPGPRVVAGPAGVHDPFASHTVSTQPAPRAVTSSELRDPFAKRGAQAPPIQKLVIGTPAKPGLHGASAVGYIVVLASIPLDEGRGVATNFAAHVRARGISGVGVLDSSSRKPLRHGYWVVYIGTYKTVVTAETAAVRVRGLGYGEAYLRQLVRAG